MTKQCITCKNTKDISEFHKERGGADGYRNTCIICRNQYQKEYRSTHPGQRTEYNRQWWLKHKHDLLPNKRIRAKAYYAASRDTYLKRIYNISEDFYNNLLQQQNYVCAICKQKCNHKALAVDHNHRTGHVRGLLCHKCNVGLGHFEDNKEFLLSAIDYLNKH